MSKTNKETIKLYGGEEEIVFYPDSHRYKRPGQKTYLVSTTSVTGIISPFQKTKALQQWAVNIGCDHIHEYLDDIFFIEIDDDLEKKLKGAGFSTIKAIDTAEEKDLLLIDGVERADISEISRVLLLVSDAITIEEMQRLVEQARYKHKEALDEAASIGDEVHAFAEEFARRRVAGEEMTDDMLEFIHPETEQAVHGFLDWVESNEVEFLVAEKVIYSRRHEYVGTFDLVARVNGVLTLIDFKTSKYIYLGHKLQTSGYWSAFTEENDFLSENYPDQAIDGGIEQAMVVRFDKGLDDDGKLIPFTPENNIWTLDQEHYPLFRDTFLDAVKVKSGLKEINRL